MKKLFTIFISVYFGIGVLLLPSSDFSALTGLPAMYQHCKSTEDCDMNIVDFVTDHLLNIDGIFDDHNHGDKQKPHKNPVFKHHIPIQIAIIENQFTINFKKILPQIVSNFTYKHFSTSDYYGSVFKPPRVINI